MGSLMDQTEIALAAVLGLCGGITQEDVGAVQRHDEAAIALFDVNEDDAAKVRPPCRWLIALRMVVIGSYKMVMGNSQTKTNQTARFAEATAVQCEDVALYHILRSIRQFK